MALGLVSPTRSLSKLKVFVEFNFIVCLLVMGSGFMFTAYCTLRNASNTFFDTLLLSEFHVCLTKYVGHIILTSKSVSERVCCQHSCILIPSSSR